MIENYHFYLTIYILTAWVFFIGFFDFVNANKLSEWIASLLFGIFWPITVSVIFGLCLRSVMKRIRKNKSAWF